MLASNGHAVTIVSMTPGDCGSRETGPEETAAIRRKEAAAAAACIGASYRCAEFRDLAIFNDDAARRRVTELLRSLRPDAVITASPSDYHCDHEATSALVRDACFAASAPNYTTQAEHPAEALPAIPHLYYADAVAGADRFGVPVAPDLFVNVTHLIGKKREMLALHASQLNWLRAQHGIDDYLDTMERWSRQRGLQVGVGFAEGFRRYPGHPYPQTPLLEGLLDPHVIVRSSGVHNLPE